MNIFDLLESPGMGRPRDTIGIQSAADQSAASVIGSGTTEHEEKKKPVRMMGQNVKESVEEAAVKPNFKMPPESLQDKMYRQHQELRKQRGAPSAEEYKQRIAQKQAEIDALKESSYASDKNYQEAPAYKNYKIYVGKKPFVKKSTGEKYYIAVTNIGKEEIKEKGTSAEEAVAAIQEKIDFVLNAQRKVSANATLDFNVKFATDILSSPREPFFAKVENRGGEPKLIIASKDWLDFGKDLVQIGFKPSALRIDSDSETSTPLPSISYTKNQMERTGLIANGRYEIGNMSTDEDGFNVFDLTYHSTAHTKSDKLRLNKPAVTVGTVRSVDVNEGILDRAAPKLPKPRNPADQVLQSKVNAGGRHLDKKRRQELNPKHKNKDPLDEGAISNAIASAALAGSMALGGMAHAGESIVGMGQSQNMQMAVDMAKMNAKIKYMKTIYGDNFQDKQMPEYHFGKVDLKPGKDGGYQASVPLIVDAEQQNESLRPGEYHHFETDPETGKRVYKGIRGDQYDAPKRGTDDPAARADQERKAHIQHDRKLTEKEVDGESIGDRKWPLPKGDHDDEMPGDTNDDEMGIDETIRKINNQYRLLSRKGKNLGTFDSKAGAEKHEREVQYFKHMKEGIDSKFVVTCYNSAIDKEETILVAADDEYDAKDKINYALGRGSQIVDVRPARGDEPTDREYKTYKHPTSGQSRTGIFDRDQDVVEGWKSKVAGTALALGALGGIGKVIQDNPNVTINDITYAKATTMPNRELAKDLKVQTDEQGNKIYTFYYKGKHGYLRPYYYPVEKEDKHKITKIKGKEYLQHELPNNKDDIKLTTDDNGNKVYAWVQKSGMKPQYTYYWFAPAEKVNEQGVDEGIKSKIAGAALAGAAALSGGHADAQQINLPGPQAVMIAHVQAEVNGREVNRTVNLGTQYQSEQQAEQDLEEYMQSKGITRYSIRIEQKFDQPGVGYGQQRRGSGYATGGSYATAPIYAPGLGDMVVNRIGQEIRGNRPDRGGYATGGSNKGERPRDGSQWWRDQVPYMREEALEEDIERHLLQMRRAGYDIVQEEWSDKYKDSINCSNPKGFSQKAHCAGKKKNEDVSEEKVRLDPKCWKGKKIGNPKTKMKGGVRVNNCVPK